MNRQQIRRNARVEHHMRLVEPLARHYAAKSGQDPDDLLQGGWLGLCGVVEAMEAKGKFLSQPLLDPISEGRSCIICGTKPRSFGFRERFRPAIGMLVPDLMQPLSNVDWCHWPMT